MVAVISLLLGLVGGLLIFLNGEQRSLLNSVLLIIGIFLISVSGFIRGVELTISKCS